MEKIYLDYAASAPADLRVAEVFFQAMGKFGNPGSIHSFGQEARNLIEDSRKKIAEICGAKTDGVVFTSSATEANNLVLRGIFNSWKRNFPEKKFRAVASEIEHDSVYWTLKDLEKDGAEIIWVKPDKDGCLNAKEVSEKAVKFSAALVVMMHVNNETGAIQPVLETSRILKKEKEKRKSVLPFLFSDMTQSFQYFDCDLKKTGVDAMVFSGHKICAPKGAGVLVFRPEIFMEPIIFGGHQENGWRPGTENAAAISALAKAAELAVGLRKKEKQRLGDLRLEFFKGLKKIFPEGFLNGDLRKSSEHILNFCFSGKKAEEILIKADLNGLAVSAGSACASRIARPSRPILAMGLKEKEALASLRFSFGRFTKKSEIKKALKIIKDCL